MKRTQTHLQLSGLALGLLLASPAFAWESKTPQFPTPEAPTKQTAESTPEAEANSETEAKTEAETATIQLAILLDTSGSMNGLINQARTQLWKIVNELATAKQNGKSPALTVALYEYGKSSIPRDENHLRMILPLTDDLDKVSEELFSLTTNGGQEYCGAVIQAATEGLQWSKSNDALKLVYVCGNEGFAQGPVKYQDACAAAIKKGIIVNTIFCGPTATGQSSGWSDGAALADGSYLSIDQNTQVAQIATPFDKKLAQLSGKVNTTYLAYGSKNKRAEAKQRQVQQDLQAQGASPAAPAQRAVTKSSGFYKASTWDLVDALRDGKVKLKDLKTEQLPEELQKMTLEQRKEYIETKGKEREAIQKEIQDLAKQRKEYIAKERKKLAEAETENTLDEAIIKSVKKHAAKKNFKFEEN